MSKKKDRYSRKFDWEKAKQLHEEGIPTAWIAKKFGVSPGAVRRVVVPGEMERMRDYAIAYSKGQGVCENCGASTNKVSQKNGSRFCVSCATSLRTRTVRETELQCSHCKQWKPDDQFHRSSRKQHEHRRGRRSYCKRCANRVRSEYRDRARVPCKGGCGRSISIVDQRAAKKYKQNKVTLGYCPYCSPTTPFLNAGQKQKILKGATKFREAFEVASAETGTTKSELRKEPHAW